MKKIELFVLTSLLILTNSYLKKFSIDLENILNKNILIIYFNNNNLVNNL